MAPLSRETALSLAATRRSRASFSRFRLILRESAAYFRLVITSALREIPRGDNETGPAEAAIGVHEAHDLRGHCPSPSPCNHLYHNTLIPYLPVWRRRGQRGAFLGVGVRSITHMPVTASESPSKREFARQCRKRSAAGLAPARRAAPSGSASNPRQCLFAQVLRPCPAATETGSGCGRGRADTRSAGALPRMPKAVNRRGPLSTEGFRLDSCAQAARAPVVWFARGSGPFWSTVQSGIAEPKRPRLCASRHRLSRRCPKRRSPPRGGLRAVWLGD